MSRHAVRVPDRLWVCTLLSGPPIHRKPSRISKHRRALLAEARHSHPVSVDPVAFGISLWHALSELSQYRLVLVETLTAHGLYCDKTRGEIGDHLVYGGHGNRIPRPLGFGKETICVCAAAIVDVVFDYAPAVLDDSEIRRACGLLLTNRVLGW